MTRNVPKIRKGKEKKNILWTTLIWEVLLKIEGTFATQLISDAGLKEYRVGDAQVSFKHPNFIINLGNAKFSDVIGVIEHVKFVFEKFNVMLETEVIILKNSRD